MARNRKATEKSGERAFTLKRPKSASAEVTSSAKTPVMPRVAAP